MTTMTCACLAESQQTLIDARLDTIERMLQGRIPRSDRTAIIDEVESQIHELLAESDPQSITDEDVLNVLRRLDPPEAYLSNDDDDVSERPSARRPAKAFHPATTTQQPVDQGARTGGIIGICSLGLILLSPLAYLLALVLHSEEILLLSTAGLGFLGIAAGIVGLVMSIRSRHQGVFPILGIVASCLAIPIWIAGGLYVVLLIRS